MTRTPTPDDEKQKREASKEEIRTFLKHIEDNITLLSGWISEKEIRAGISEVRDIVSNTQDWDTIHAIAAETRRYTIPTILANILQNGIDNPQHMGVVNDVGRICYFLGYGGRLRAERKKGPQPLPFTHTKDVLLPEIFRTKSGALTMGESQAEFDWPKAERTHKKYEKEFKKDPTIDHASFVTKDYFKRVKG